MPTYEYVCEQCAYEFEKEQKISEEPIRTCPKCKGSVKRMISSGSNFILKGSGWYASDYSQKATAAPAKEAPACTSGCPGCPSAK